MTLVDPGRSRREPERLLSSVIGLARAGIGRWTVQVDSRGLAARSPLRPVAFGVSVMNMVAPPTRYSSAVASSGPAHAAEPAAGNNATSAQHTGSISYLAATEPGLAHGASRWARVVNAFTFDLTTRLRYEFCCRAGPSIGDWPGGLATGRCDLRPSQPKLGEVFAEPQRILIGSRSVGVSMRRRSRREQKGLDNDNGRNIRGGFEQDC